jgi:hypothetical protein
MLAAELQLRSLPGHLSTRKWICTTIRNAETLSIWIDSTQSSCIILCMKLKQQRFFLITLPIPNHTYGNTYSSVHIHTSNMRKTYIKLVCHDHSHMPYCDATHPLLWNTSRQVHCLVPRRGARLQSAIAKDTFADDIGHNAQHDRHPNIKQQHVIYDIVKHIKTSPMPGPRRGPGSNAPALRRLQSCVYIDEALRALRAHSFHSIISLHHFAQSFSTE